VASSKIKNPTKSLINIGRLSAVNDTITLPDSFTHLYARININDYYFGDIKEIRGSHNVHNLLFGHNTWIGFFRLTTNGSAITWTNETTAVGSKSSDWITIIDLYIS
jgi:hypothetical protein